jgi:Restriction endonuclease
VRTSTLRPRSELQSEAHKQLFDHANRIRRSLFGRSTYGRIAAPSGLDLDPYKTLDRLMTRSARPALIWTTDIEKVEQRLLDGVGPNAFEHLCVHLLQLEEPRNRMHVGGGGDGGVDGEGASRAGKVVGLLQCKWSYDGEEIDLGQSRHEKGIRRIVAAMICKEQPSVSEGVEYCRRPKTGTVLTPSGDPA